jgi:hypothetical protein
MRLLVALLFLIVPSSAQSIEFLQGVWTSGQTAIEFHWAQRNGEPMLVGRTWTGKSQACPWCVASSAMAIYYDADSRLLRLHVKDRSQRIRDLSLETERKGFLEFVAESGDRIVFESTRPDQLSMVLGGVTALTLQRK